MIRKAFRMSVNAGSEAEYERRHNPLPGDLEQVLLEHGVSTYSIFLDPESRDLFAYVEFESEELWQRIADTNACRRWWRCMRDVMPANEDDSPASRDLREVFHIDSGTGVGASARARVEVACNSEVVRVTLR